MTSLVLSASQQAVRESHFVFRLLARIPLLGIFVLDMLKSDTAAIFFFANFIMLWVFSGFIWGMAGIFTVALALVPTMILTLVLLTRG